MDSLVYQWLMEAIKSDSSDLHLSSGLPPSVRRDGEICYLDHPVLVSENLFEMVSALMSDAQLLEFEHMGATDFSFEMDQVCRFRVNVYKQFRGVAAAFRLIPLKIPSLVDIGAPQIITDFANLENGLVLLTGPTGSGKSTSVAAVVNEINRTRSAHVITIEDPIEFVHQSNKSIINQRQLHAHTKSFDLGLRAALREDPDVIVVGEMRDVETIRLALSAAETGHLVLSTLHTSSVVQSINRIVDVFPGHEQSTVRSMLADSLKGVVSQMLLPLLGGGRSATWEVMVATSATRNLIREGKSAQLYSVIETGAERGMQTMVQGMKKLREKGIVDELVLNQRLLRAEELR